MTLSDRLRMSVDRRALLEAVERSTQAGLAAVNEHGEQTYVNPAFCAMVGYTAEELLGQRAPFSYWPPEELAAIEEAFRKTIRGEAPPDGFELRFMRKSGERFHAQLLLSALADADGTPLGYLASL